MFRERGEWLGRDEWLCIFCCLEVRHCGLEEVGGLKFVFDRVKG